MTDHAHQKTIDYAKVIGIMITFATMVFAAGGGWYEVRQLRKDMEVNSARDEKLLVKVEEIGKVQLLSTVELAKIKSLEETISNTGNLLNERMNNFQERINTISETANKTQSEIDQIKANTRDRIERTPVEKWILSLERDNPDLVVPSLPAG